MIKITIHMKVQLLTKHHKCNHCQYRLVLNNYFIIDVKMISHHQYWKHLEITVKVISMFSNIVSDDLNFECFFLFDLLLLKLFLKIKFTLWILSLSIKSFCFINIFISAILTFIHFACLLLNICLFWSVIKIVRIYLFL